MSQFLYTRKIKYDLCIPYSMDWYESNWFKHGVESDFPLCCIIWFMNCWHEIPEDIVESWSSDRDGYVPCPECLLRMLVKHNGS